MKNQNIQIPQFPDNNGIEAKREIEVESTFKEFSNLLINEPSVPEGFVETPFSEELIPNVSNQERNYPEINRQLPLIINK